MNNSKNLLKELKIKKLFTGQHFIPIVKLVSVIIIKNYIPLSNVLNAKLGYISTAPIYNKDVINALLKNWEPISNPKHTNVLYAKIRATL